MRTAVSAIAYPPTAQDEAARRAVGRPNPAQRRFHQLPAAHKAYIGGFGAGKTAAGVYETIALAMANPGAMGIATAPTWGHTLTMIDTFRLFLWAIERATGFRLAERIRTSNPPRIDWVGGGTLRFVSGWNLEALLGPTTAYGWADEAEWYRQGSGILVLRNMISRMRQRTTPGLCTVRRRSLIVTTTARTNDGVVRWVLDRARDPDNPLWDAVVAPSHQAVGYGVDRQWLADLAGEFTRQDYRRMVLCELDAPPGLVYGESISPEQWPAGNVIDCPGLRPDLPYWFGVDWGTRWPHVVVVQHDQRHDLDIIVAEWGEDGIDVAGTCEWMFARAREWGRPPQAVYMDPTDNPGDDKSGHAKRGRTILRRHGWIVQWPRGDEQRAVEWGAALVNQRLCLGNGVRRLVWARHLTYGRRSKYCETNRGTWQACTQGYRRAQDPLTGEVLDKIVHDIHWSHAADALRYAEVCLHPHEHLRTYEYLTGRWTGRPDQRKAA